jgi:cytochrome oxidase Cu insertion factor (SCO1/SenC/PrrC family)
LIVKHITLALCFAVGLAAAAAAPPRPRDGNLKVGDAAPDFALQDLAGKTTVKLSALKGKPVVLVFGSCT